MFIDLSDKNIVVAGGGNIATRRVKTLLKFTRNITVVATKVTQELMDLGKAGTVNLHIRPVKRSDFASAYMVIAATNDWKLNDEIHRVCREEGIYVRYFAQPRIDNYLRVSIGTDGQMEALYAFLRQYMGKA